jgi:Domain of unknown function (DUF4265)
VRKCLSIRNDHMSKNFVTQKYEKVIFRLQQDADGYPPDDWESLWAYEVEPGLYSIDNIPFFARGVSWGDVVSAEQKDDGLYFKSVVRPSDHSVIRVIVYDKAEVGKMHDKLKQMHCDTEQSHLPSLITVDCPPTADLEKVLDFLRTGETDGRWTYEEASIRHP